MSAKLTAKQATFIQEYLIDLNATQAAIRAGYSKKTAKEIGCENLTKPNIQEAIAEAMAERSARTEITADRVLEEIAKIGFSDIRDIFTNTDGLMRINDLPDDIASCVQSVEVVIRPSGEFYADGNKVVEYVHKIRLSDKLRGLELLGKHLVLFSDKVVHTGGVDLIWQVEMVEPDHAEDS